MNTVDQTVQATSGKPAASVSDTPSGTGSSCPASTTTFSAYPPPLSNAHTCERGQQGIKLQQKKPHLNSPPEQKQLVHSTHLIADGPSRGHVGAEREDGAGALEPRVGRRAGGRRVAAVALESVGAVDAGGRDLEEDLAFSQRRGVLHLLGL
jgi:hypothetical protein